MHQYPEPGGHLLRFRGDIQRFVLTVSGNRSGTAWLRTTLGHAEQLRGEVVRAVQKELPPLGEAWFDIPMRSLPAGKFEVVVPLREAGHFEAKCYFLPEGTADPLWPEGANTILNVEPAHTCCANLVYNAFVRQFGSAKQMPPSERLAPEGAVASLDKAGYTVIPPSGTFRDLLGELDFIFSTLGCRYLQLLPIHPTPTTYGRMGRFGSPYAALSFTDVDPALAVFDPQATPLEQFIELVDGVHQRHGKLILDIAINHTGWAASLHESHPEWLSRDKDGCIQVPGAWGVRWEDLTKLDYGNKALWVYMAEVFLTWCRRGVDGFRCDAGYMILLPAWRFIINRVREEYPDTLFLLEGLGGKVSDTRNLLDEGNFNWAYSELFQNYDRAQIESYLPEALDISATEGILLHFAETHDNLRLAATSRTYARLRTDLCALFAPNGAFGFANGVEWFATEKIDVHDASGLNWGAKENQVAEIARLSTLLKYHPAFQDDTELSLVQKGTGNHVALFRRHRPTGKTLLILANLDHERDTTAAWDESFFDPKEGLTDLLTEERIRSARRDGHPSCVLSPGRVLCLARDPEDIRCVHPQASLPEGLVPRIVHQQLRAKVLDVLHACTGKEDVGSLDLDREAERLFEDPGSFVPQHRPPEGEPLVVRWQWPADLKREVMVPPGHFLLVTAPVSFSARITEEDRTLVQEESLPTANGAWFVLFSPLPVRSELSSRELKVALFLAEGCRRNDSPLLYLPSPDSLRTPMFLSRRDLLETPRTHLSGNGRGGMLRIPVVWGDLQSRYDALLAGNRSKSFPQDRWVMFTRCRAWIVYQGHSQEVGFDAFHTYHRDGMGRGIWRFHIPTGQGEHIRLTVRMEMVAGENAVHLLFFRHPAQGRSGRLADDRPVRLILRPDVESRSYHDITKAYQGPEESFPRGVAPRPEGFCFAPDSAGRLDVALSRGHFVPAPEWQYMIHYPADEARGFDPQGDLFSPGYFQTELTGATPVVLTARICFDSEQALREETLPDLSEDELYGSPSSLPVEEVLRGALDAFVVRRGGLKTVIAGYPWFLDWGRDSLIVVRGLTAAGRLVDAKAVLRQFGQFEEKGTLPNMIAGKDPANRDTSDAPLWFFLGCQDVVEKEASPRFLDSQAGSRTVREILFSIARGYMAGTPNGIRMDSETGLIFSPAHYTWMDTNHPAGTPREGYPIEIQALWCHALTFLSRIDPAGKQGPWALLEKQVRAAIRELYLLPEGFLSDCLHTPAGSAAQAEPRRLPPAQSAFCRGPRGRDRSDSLPEHRDGL